MRLLLYMSESGELTYFAEAVVLLAGVLLDDGEARLLQHLKAVAVLQRVVGEVAPLVEAVAQPEALDDLVAETAPVEVAQAHGAPHLVVVEQVGEILLRKLAHVEQAVSLRLPLLLLLGLLLLFYLDVVLVGQPAQRLGVGVVLVLHEELHHVARLAAAEAFEDALRRRHIERRRLLVVERAAAYMVGATLLERHKIAYHLLDAGGVHDALYGLLVNHSGCKITHFPRHGKKNIGHLMTNSYTESLSTPL